MLDLNSPVNNKNSKLLLQGIWYSDLPDLLDMQELLDSLHSVLDAVNQCSISQYLQDQDGFITGWTDMESPPYVRKPGVEAITYFDFKRNNSLREMQIPNIIHYISFIYNTLLEFTDIFENLYIDSNNHHFVEHSNSYLVFEDEFVISSYEGNEEIEMAGTFATMNTKVNGSTVLEENKRRLLAAEAGYLYSLKMDIESFFPNIYTHYFEKISNRLPFNEITSDNKYFNFLDSYHQRINNNQTKGIPAGVFSSHVAAELCMLCVDQEIMAYINDQATPIAYVRYVDDLTFYSDSESELKGMLSVTQAILNNYRLRINGNKTETLHTVHLSQPSYINELEKEFSMLKQSEESKEMKLSDLLEIRKYIAACLTANRLSQIRALLSIINNRISQDKLSISGLQEFVFNYVFKLAFEENMLVCHAYRLLAEILKRANNRSNMVDSLIKKQTIVDKEYPDTLMQIWYYYLVFKYASDEQKEELITSATHVTYNPLVLSAMVTCGKKRNSQLFKIIRDTYIRESGSSQWKKEIMFSKWWLPLFKISRYDSHNYDSFIKSRNFPEILRMFGSHSAAE